MEVNLEEFKPSIRSILLALGRRATEREFRSEFYNTEGQSFDAILRVYQMKFCDFMKKFPDVCRIWRIGEETMIERVSNEETSHMDNLTTAQNKRKLKKR